MEIVIGLMLVIFLFAFLKLAVWILKVGVFIITLPLKIIFGIIFVLLLLVLIPVVVLPVLLTVLVPLIPFLIIGLLMFLIFKLAF